MVNPLSMVTLLYTRALSPLAVAAVAVLNDHAHLMTIDLMLLGHQQLYG